MKTTTEKPQVQTPQNGPETPKPKHNTTPETVERFGEAGVFACDSYGLYSDQEMELQGILGGWSPNFFFLGGEGGE